MSNPSFDMCFDMFWYVFMVKCHNVVNITIFAAEDHRFFSQVVAVAGAFGPAASCASAHVVLWLLWYL